MRVQFAALGLLVCRMERRQSDDTDKDVRVCVLKPYGKQQLLKVKAVYKDPPPTTTAKTHVPPERVLKRARLKRRAALT